MSDYMNDEAAHIGPIKPISSPVSAGNGCNEAVAEKPHRCTPSDSPRMDGKLFEKLYNSR